MEGTPCWLRVLRQDGTKINRIRIRPGLSQKQVSVLAGTGEAGRPCLTGPTDPAGISAVFTSLSSEQSPSLGARQVAGWTPHRCPPLSPSCCCGQLLLAGIAGREEACRAGHKGLGGQGMVDRSRAAWPVNSSISMPAAEWKATSTGARLRATGGDAAPTASPTGEVSQGRQSPAKRE